MPRWNDIKPWPGYTLRSLADVHYDIATWCPVCRAHGVVFRPETLARRLGDGLRVRDLVNRLVCAYCGERSAELQLAVRHEMTISRLMRGEP